MANKIVWQKWVDPFLTNEDDVETTDSSDKEPDGYRDSYQKLEDKLLTNKEPIKQNTGPVIVGPMGIIPLNEYNAPGKVFCFWLGHTNFDITSDTKDILDKTPGVETLDIFTRYRFRVSVGKAFLDEKTDPFGRSVLQAIEEALCPKVKSIKKNTKVTGMKILKKNLSSKYQFWAILESEDGTLDPRNGQTKEEVMKLIEDSHKNVVAKSWE